MATKRTGSEATLGIAKTIKKFLQSSGLILEFIGRPFLYLFLGVLFLLSRLSRLLPQLLLLLSRIFIQLTVFLTKILALFLFPVFKLLNRLSRLPSQIKAPKLPQVKLTFPRPWKLILLSLALFSFAFAAFSAHQIILKDLPHPDRLISRPQAVSTKIYDRHGRLLYKIYRQQNRTLVKIEDIPSPLIQATIAIEDAEFYQHHGFSLRGISRSFIKNLREGKLQGGSTITQQLVKNALLTSEKTLVRKLKELVLSIQVEARFDKEQILQMYLNEVGYGGAAYGAEEAAWKYFGKSVRELNLAESALLAGLPASPTLYSPFGAHPELAKTRQIQVLQRMVAERFITPEQAQKAQAIPLQFAPQAANLQAPHFVIYVKDLLVKTYGEQLVEEGGLEVFTTLDLDIQNLAQEIVAQEVNRLQKLNVKNGAALVIAPQTGEILAMVGSRDYFDLENDGNVNVTLRPRQPGSAIKPVNYAVALSSGFTAATLLSDTPITYQIPGQPPYSPRNYDNRFHGQIPLRVALASSYNVPAVKVLSSYGVEKMIEMGQKLGITTWDDPQRFGLSLTLGGGEVKMIDLAAVYGTLANLGQKVELNPILQIRDYRGKIYQTPPCPLQNDQSFEYLAAQAAPQPTCPSQQVLDPRIAFLLNDILADNQARTPAFGSRSLLNIPSHTVAVKTGTTNDLRDNWTIGYTPRLLVATWVGNNDNSPMSRIASGLTGASSIWNQIITSLLTNQENQPFPRPEGLVEVEICSLTGTLPCPGCPSRKEIFLAGTEPKTHCRLEEKEETEREKVLGTQTENPPDENYLPPGQVKKDKPRVINYQPPQSGEIIWERIER